MTTTPRLAITQLEQSQVQKEAVVNEAIAFLEMFATRLIVLSQGDNAPAGGEVDGDAYLVGSSGTGAFLGHDDELAMLINGAWEFRPALEGMEIRVLDEDATYILTDGSWVTASLGALDDLSDVDAPTPSDGDVLTWNNADGEWQATAVPGSSGVPSGTSFPGSPSTNDLFFRTDRGLIYFYDGTRWLSSQQFTAQIVPLDAIFPATVTMTSQIATNPWNGLYDIYVTEIVTFVLSIGTLNWTIAVASVGTGAATLQSYSVSTATEAVTRTTVNAVVPSTIRRFNLTLTENSGTGSVYVQPVIIYRLVG